MRASRLLVLSLLVSASLRAGAAGTGDPLPDARLAGQKLYVGKCARCHKFYDPTRYSDTEWDAWMTKMRRKARLTDDQYQQLIAYFASVRQNDRPK
jgi:mono/diheme cytochrome c family protein